MRILIVCDVLFPGTVGGAGRVARELAQACKRQGMQVAFLTRSVTGSSSTDDIPSTSLPAPGITAAPWRFRNAFHQAVEGFNPDIVHSHQPLPAFFSIPAAYRGGRVYTFHSSWPEEFRIKSSRVPGLLRRTIAPLLSSMEKSVLRASDVVIALSEFSRREAQRLHSIDPIVIPGGVDIRRFRPAPYQSTSNTTHLITVRNLVPRMGLAELIRAMTSLPSGVRLTIGGDGPLKRGLQNLIAALSLSDRVQLAGRISEDALPGFYAGADWFVLPTVALEGFGLVTLESLACGTPVVGTAVGATPELLARFDSNWIIPEATPQSIANTLKKVLNGPRPDPLQLHSFVAKTYSWDSIADRYIDVFERVQAKRS